MPTDPSLSSDRDLSGLSDHELLLGGRWEVAAANRASGARWARVVELHRRRAAVQPPPAAPAVRPC